MVQIPPDYAWPQEVGVGRGFLVRTHIASRRAGILENSIARAEAQIGGILNDPAINQPYGNQADFTRQPLNQDGYFEIGRAHV